MNHIYHTLDHRNQGCWFLTEPSGASTAIAKPSSDPAYLCGEKLGTLDPCFAPHASSIKDLQPGEKHKTGNGHVLLFLTLPFPDDSL